MRGAGWEPVIEPGWEPYGNVLATVRPGIEPGGVGAPNAGAAGGGGSPGPRGEPSGDFEVS